MEKDNNIIEELYNTDEVKELRNLKTKALIVTIVWMAIMTLILGVIVAVCLVKQIFINFYVLSLLLLLIGIIPSIVISSYNEKSVIKEELILEKLLIDFLRRYHKEEKENRDIIELLKDIDKIDKDTKHIMKFNVKSKNVNVFSNLQSFLSSYSYSYKYYINYITVIDVDIKKNIHLETIPREYLTKKKYLNNTFKKAFINHIELKDEESSVLTEEDKKFFMDIYEKYELFFEIIIKDGKIILKNRLITDKNNSIKKTMQRVCNIVDFIEEMIQELDIYFSKKEF